MNTSQQLHAAGQSVWYDNVERRLLNNGELAGMVARGEVRGLTSNPTIFMNAVTKSNDYDAALAPLARAGKTGEEIFWELAIEDIRAAADLLRPVYEESDRGDGYVSLEVNPLLANDTAGTLAEAVGLWKRVDRPNLMVKIPATIEGLPAVAEAIEAGVNVNVTLIFSRERYWAVMDAYLKGLERRQAKGLPLDGIASVASFFVSRVDTKVDGRLAGLIERRKPRPQSARARLRSPMPGWRTTTIRSSSVRSASRHSQRAAPACNGRCGPPPARRTRRTAMWSTSKS